MEVANERRGAAGIEHTLLDLRNRGRGLRHVDRDPHHVRSGLRELDALLRRPAGICRVGHRHRLDDDRRAAADLHHGDTTTAANLHADCPMKSHQAHVGTISHDSIR